VTTVWLPFMLLPLAAVWCWLRRVGIGAGAERVALATGFGLALSSAAYFVARWVGVTPSWDVPFECTVATVGIVTGLEARWGRPRWRTCPSATSRSPPLRCWFVSPGPPHMSC